MMGEGSVGKIRFAGLAFMLEQDGIINLQQNAKAFFSSRKVTDFLEETYPETRIQEEIIKFFSGNSADATLADLTTHSSGVGDLTRDQGRHFDKIGINSNYNLPTLLSQPLDNQGIPLKENIPRDALGKPRAQSGPNIKEQDLPIAKHGEHQYSNLGYALLGVALEGAYAAKKGKRKTYKQLMNDYMLHPIEGRAANRNLEFNNTRFPEDIAPGDNVMIAHWHDKATNTSINANHFNGANSAGGMFCSANDSEKYFKEYFTGFPGTAEFNKGKNNFFSDDTIKRITAEQDKFISKDRDNKGNHRSWGPGYIAVVNPETKEVLQYDKGGGCFGYASKMVFYPKTSTVDIRIVAQENITGIISKEVGVKISDLMNTYRNEDKTFDRGTLIKDYQESNHYKIKAKVIGKSLSNTVKFQKHTHNTGTNIGKNKNNIQR